MNIRSITVFLPLRATRVHPSDSTEKGESLNPYLTVITKLRQESERIFAQEGIDIQSYRLATNPFGTMLDPFHPENCLEWALYLEQQTAQTGFDYLSLGPAQSEIPATIQTAVEILRRTSNVFVSARLNNAGSIDIPFVRQVASAIQSISQIDPNGFANLRFAALANVPAGAPFFPAAYHQGDTLAYSLAMEAADLFIEEINQARDFLDAHDRLRARLEKEAARVENALQKVVSALENEFSPSPLNFLGIDFTPAPYPEVSRSIGTALERLGLEAVGAGGTLAGAAFLTSCLDSASYRRSGFNGLMLPVLEDATLAQRAAQGKLSVNDLLLYSAVCGTGLDTIPLAGDVSEDALTGVLLDLAALALRLDKPLTARLMPIPGKKAGDQTNFDFGYFANSHILPIKEGKLKDLFTRSNQLTIFSRKSAEGNILTHS